MAEKLPRLNVHLKEHFIDVTLVTFNWFLTLFVDALPTDVSLLILQDLLLLLRTSYMYNYILAYLLGLQSILRILDCFLMEGHKLLFRVSLGILKLNEGVILSKTDPVTLFQFLKEIARHCFDIDAVFHVRINSLFMYTYIHVSYTLHVSRVGICYRRRLLMSWFLSQIEAI